MRTLIRNKEYKVASPDLLFLLAGSELAVQLATYGKPKFDLR